MLYSPKGPVMSGFSHWDGAHLICFYCRCPSFCTHRTKQLGWGLLLSGGGEREGRWLTSSTWEGSRSGG